MRYKAAGIAVLVATLASQCLLGRTGASCRQLPNQQISSQQLPKHKIQGTLEKLNVDGRDRNFFVHFPPGFDKDKPYPLVILLHGGGGNHLRAMKITAFDRKADQEGFILVLPNGSGYFKLYTWNSDNCCGVAKRHHIDDVSFMRSLIARLESEYTIDKQRIYITGESNGGMLAYKVAAEMSDEIAAIAPVAASMSGRERAPAYPVSVIAFNGTADKTVPYLGGVGIAYMSRFRIKVEPVSYAVSFWKERNQCSVSPMVEEHGNVNIKAYDSGLGGSTVEEVTIEGGNHSWPGGKKNWLLARKPNAEICATDAIWDFFKTHPKIGIDKSSVAAEPFGPKPKPN